MLMWRKKVFQRRIEKEGSTSHLERTCRPCGAALLQLVRLLYGAAAERLVVTVPLHLCPDVIMHFENDKEHAARRHD